MTQWNEDKKMKKRTKEDKRGLKYTMMMKWWNDDAQLNIDNRVAVQAWITLCVTLQPPWLDIELSEWIFDNVLLTVNYTISTQVEYAPLEMFILSSIVTNLANDVVINIYFCCSLPLIFTCNK
jgi:hypothetical protein